MKTSLELSLEQTFVRLEDGIKDAEEGVYIAGRLAMSGVMRAGLATEADKYITEPEAQHLIALGSPLCLRFLGFLPSQGWPAPK